MSINKGLVLCGLCVVIRYNIITTMPEEKKEVFKLRKRGKSYSEIAATLGVPKSTISAWLRKEAWSRDIKKMLVSANTGKSRERIPSMNAKRQEKLKLLYEEARSKAKQEFNYLKHSPLFIAGLVCYMGEGDKTSKGTVKVSNVDPVNIKIFTLFLRRVCDIKDEKIRCCIAIYRNSDDKECRLFWSENTALPPDNFTKSIIIKGRRSSQEKHFGMCNIAVSSRYLKEKMLIWLNLLKDEFDAGMV